MLNFFNSKKKKKQHRGNDYYHRENLIQTIDVLIKELKMLDSPDSIISSKPLLFQNQQLNSISINNLKIDLGKEQFLLDPESKIKGHNIRYYRKASGNLRFLQQLHFIDDKFFFAATKISSENILLISDKNNIIDSIKKKYCNYLAA